MNTRYLAKLIRRIQSNLTPDLLQGRWKQQEHPLQGYCYVASEVLYHLLDKEEWKPCRVTYNDQYGRATHWWLEHRKTGQRLDPTQEQFSAFNLPPYHLGVGCGFLTKQPSKRAQKVLERMHNNVS